MSFLTPMQKKIVAYLRDKEMQTCTKQELIEEIGSLKSARFMGIVTLTDPSMNKTNNPFWGRVKKIAKSSVRVNVNYENAVNNQREREGKESDFESTPNWCVPVFREDGTRTPFYKHRTNGDLYLGCIIDSAESTFVDDENQDVDKRELEPFLKKTNRDGQGVDRPIKFATFKLDSIVAVTQNGKTKLVV